MQDRRFFFICAALKVCTALFGGYLIQPAMGGTIRHDRPDSSYTSLAASYPAVGALTWSSYICSATLIDDNWILTAGHCLDAVGLQPSDWTFDLSDSGGGVHVGAERFVNPGWTGGCPMVPTLLYSALQLRRPR
jgi:hypothetical protein